MPESPLVQKETVALADLEALIAKRAKDETETETGFRRRIEREENEYRAAARQLAGKYKVDSEALEADYGRARDDVNETHQRDTQATKNDYAQEKHRIDDQFKKDQRRAKKLKEEAGWQALAVFEGTRDDGIKWRRGTESKWAGTIDEFHVRQDEAAHLLKQCGRLAKGSPEEEAAALAAAAAAPPIEAPPPQPGETPGDDGAVVEAAEQPTEDNPLTHLRAGLTVIEDELIALDSLKLLRFLQMQVFLWPFLLLGGGVAGCAWDSDLDRLDWRLHRRGRRGPGWRDRGLDRPGEDGPAARAAPCRPAAQGGRRRRASDRAEQGLGQERV